MAAPFVLAVAARGGRVVLQVERPLVRLAAGLAGEPIVVPAGARRPPFELWCPLLSLPRIFDTRPETIPATVPYLRPRPPLVERWRQRLADLTGLRVGLAWGDNPAHVNDFRRSIGIDRLAPLLRIPGVSWVSLQVGPRAEELARLPSDMVIDLSAGLHDLSETAGAIRNLDLVITADTAVAHLAGALAKPVWTLLPFSPDWRWLLDREDSPWYPTMRLYRQPAPGDWDSVVARAAERLRDLAMAWPQGRQASRRRSGKAWSPCCRRRLPQGLSVPELGPSGARLMSPPAATIE